MNKSIQLILLTILIVFLQAVNAIPTVATSDICQISRVMMAYGFWRRQRPIQTYLQHDSCAPPNAD